jgi:hypothetical protein
MGWGKRYANVNVEDVGGKQNRIKVDTEIFDDYREIVDSGVGTAVILHASVNKRFENMRAHFLIDLEQYRKKIEKGEPLNLWEKIAKGEHPAKEWEWGTPEKARERQYNDRFYNDDLRETKTDLFTGIVTHVKTKPDKRDAEMAFFGLIDVGSKYIDCVCFASHWITLKKHIATGRLAKVALDKGDRGGGYLVSGRYTEWLKKSAKVEGTKK